MKASAPEKQALIGLMNRMVEDIRQMETGFGLRVGGGDMRPRIEYFHDAVRALTSDPDAARAGKGRLSVEKLAYDAQMLRHIIDTPLAAIGKPSLSPGTALIAKPHGPNGKPDREARRQLSELYRNYSVLFIALLAESADRNYHNRVDELNDEVSDLAKLQQVLQQVAAGKANPEQLEALMHQVENEEVQQKIALLLHHHTQIQRKKREIAEALEKLKGAMQGADKEIAVLQKAHMHYLSSQLMMYEQSREVVKQMAMQGMNLAGKFVENAMRAAGQQRGTRGF